MTFSLTSGNDAFAGSSGDDVFTAALSQNDGGVSNTLATGDVLDGGYGTDTLNAQLIPEYVGDDNDDLNLEGILTPNTQSLEVARFTVQQDTAGGFGDSEALAGVDAQDMAGTLEFWSTNSRADLVIEDVRTLSSLVTIGMQKTDGSSRDVNINAADYSVNFAPEAIVPPEQAESAPAGCSASTWRSARTAASVR